MKTLNAFEDLKIENIIDKLKRGYTGSITFVEYEDKSIKGVRYLVNWSLENQKTKNGGSVRGSKKYIEDNMDYIIENIKNGILENKYYILKREVLDYKTGQTIK